MKKTYAFIALLLFSIAALWLYGYINQVNSGRYSKALILDTDIDTGYAYAAFDVEHNLHKTSLQIHAPYDVFTTINDEVYIDFKYINDNNINIKIDTLGHFLMVPK
jgi:hypothetical protein